MLSEYIISFFLKSGVFGHDIQSGPKVWPHFFVLSRVLKLHSINLIRSYVWIAEIEYYMYTSAQFKKLLNMKYNKINKLQC